MSAKKLSKQFRDSLQSMVIHFGFHNEKQLSNADRNILGAINEEIKKADKVDLKISVDDGKVVVECNEIRHKFNDPKPERDS